MAKSTLEYLFFWVESPLHLALQFSKLENILIHISSQSTLKDETIKLYTDHNA